MDLVSEILAGMAAGAVGTMSLDVASYTDMVLRGRPFSSVPAQVAGAIAEGVGLDLAAGSDGNDGEDAANQLAESRKSGLGALMGYATGLGIGAAYGVIRPHLGRGRCRWPGRHLGLRRWRPAIHLPSSRARQICERGAFRAGSPICCHISPTGCLRRSPMRGS